MSDPTGANQPGAQGEGEGMAAGERAGNSAPKTAGAWLREARQQRGLQLDAVAAMLKVPQAKLEALEADRWQDLTDMTFVRALAKAVCRTLKIDPTPVLELLPRGVERELDVSRGINTPFRERGSRDEGLSMALLQRPLVWGPGLLLVAAAVLYLLPNKFLEPAPVPAQVPVEAPGAAASVPDDGASSAPIVAEAPAPVASTAPAVIQTAAASMPSAVPIPAPVASKPPLAVAAAPSAPQPAPSGDVLPVKIRVKSETWISVTDARGHVLIAKLVQPGEEPQLTGELPLKVVIGNVSGTELSLRGSPVDLTSQSKDNVARLELN